MIRTPTIKLTADNQPLNEQIMARLISLSVTDNKSMEADELSITLSDHDGQLQLPKRGVRLQCWLGYAGMGSHDMGSFIVDSVEWSGSPDMITIRAKSADFKGSLKEGRSQSYHQATLGQIARQVATRHQLQLSIQPDLASLTLGHIDQTDESDINLLTRLCHQYGAAVNIKHGKLLIFRPNHNQTASGQALTLRTITRQTGDQYRYSIEDRQSDYTGVTASYQDKSQATKNKAEAKKAGHPSKPAQSSSKAQNAAKDKKATVSTGNPEPKGGGNDPGKKTKHLKGVYKDKTSAEAAAHAEMQRIEQQQARFSITTAQAYPAISTESPVQLKGFKADIDALHWTVDKATHSYSKSSGLTTQLDLVASIK